MAINCLFILVSSSLTLGLGIIILVSSAYKTILALLAVVLGRSLTYNRKNNGPRIEPCGTPCLMISHSEEVLIPPSDISYLGMM
jgi:hypothetical protein